ncbi:MAG: DegV family protein [Defluviitaleaceae bacterium]|nr:DegV family protein [Defluviitaleaceae bacterium]
MFQIISDSSCDFSKYEAKRHGIGIVPFYISFDQENYLKEGIDISKEDFFKRLASEKGLFPKTSQPSPQDYIDAYEPYLKGGKDVLVLTISSKLSGSFNSASLAMEMMKEEYPDREIILVDSQNATIGQGLILREIIKMRDAGYSLSKTAQVAKEVLKTTRVYCTLDTLEYLKRGGRVGPTTAFVGGILKLNPILQLADGKVSQLDNVRGRKRALALIEEAMVDALKGETGNISLSIGHIFSEKDAAVFKASTEAALETKITNPITDIGVTIGSHVGPGALGFAYCRKYDAIKI